MGYSSSRQQQHEHGSEEEVVLYIYDLSKGVVTPASAVVSGNEISGIWHTGVVAFGREYYFGKRGITSSKEGETGFGKPDQILDLGKSSHQEFLDFISLLGKSSYKPDVFNLIKHNCNHFSDEVSMKLVGKHIPSYILELPDEVLNTHGSEEDNKVELYIYDLSKDVVSLASAVVSGNEISGNWHTGVVAFGREYYFGRKGISSCKKGETGFGKPDQILDLGNSKLSHLEFLDYICHLGKSSFKPGVYNLIKHHCNCFSEEVSMRICGRSIPSYILKLSDEVLNTHGSEEENKVQLYIYDLSKGVAEKVTSVLGKTISGIWHTGVVAFGREYYFGKRGITSSKEGETWFGKPDKILDMGNSKLSHLEFHDYISHLGKSSFKSGVYNLIKHNCNCFSEIVANVICGKSIPRRIKTIWNQIEAHIVSSPISATVVIVVTAIIAVVLDVVRSFTNFFARCCNLCRNVFCNRSNQIQQ